MFAAACCNHIDEVRSAAIGAIFLPGRNFLIRQFFAKRQKPIPTEKTVEMGLTFIQVILSHCQW